MTSPATLTRQASRPAIRPCAPCWEDWRAGDNRYASGVPLVNEVGALLAVFDPLPRSGPCPTFLVDVGVPLLFSDAKRQQRFERYKADGAS